MNFIFRIGYSQYVILQLLLGLHVGRGLEALDSLQKRLGIAGRIITHGLIGETGVDRLNVFLEGGTGLSLDLLYLFRPPDVTKRCRALGSFGST